MCQERMFTVAFFDCSSDAKRSGLVVAGYAATRERWLRFEAQWQEALQGAGLRYFRMSEFVSYRGEFKVGVIALKTK